MIDIAIRDPDYQLIITVRTEKPGAKIVGPTAVVH